MTDRSVLVSASLMCADFEELDEQLVALRGAGIQRLHLDFLDGHFAPNLALGMEVFQLVKRAPGFQLESHLMLDDPEALLHLFVGKSDWVILQIEATRNPLTCIERIVAGGSRAGLALKPETPISDILPLLPHVSLVLILTVTPGFAGGVFRPDAIHKVTELRKEIDARGLATEIEVDGGVSLERIPEMIDAGADVLVGGSSGLFTGGNLGEQAGLMLSLAASHRRLSHQAESRRRPAVGA